MNSRNFRLRLLNRTESIKNFKFKNQVDFRLIEATVETNNENEKSITLASPNSA